MWIASLLILLLSNLNGTSTYKILVFSPRFSQSINNFLGNIADTLVDAGHNVTSIIPIVNPVLRDGTLKSNKIYVESTEKVKKIAASMDMEEHDFFAYNDFNLFMSVPFGIFYMDWINSQCEGVLDTPGLVERLKEEKYDVMIVETFEACGVALSHLFKPKSLITAAASVPMGSQGTDFGLDRAMSYNPNALMSGVDVHSMWSRLQNIFANFVHYATFHTSRSGINAIFKRRYGAEFPSVYEISSHAAFSLVNTEPLIDFAAPSLSRVISIGGIGAKEPKKLDKDLDRLFSLRSRTVLISLGSILQSHTMPAQVKQNIVKTVAQFPEVTFLWKYEKPEDDFAKSVLASTPNLQMLKWTPQNDILADERLTAFITHGGMASTQETALRGKPGLFIPFFGDQPRNSGIMERSGLGRVLNKHDLFHEAKLYEAVKDLLENQSYYKNAARIAKMIAAKPFSSKQLLVKTVEFAAEFGPSAALRPQSFDMSWIEYHNADIITIFVIFILIVVYSTLKVVPFVFRKVMCIGKSKLD